MIDCEGDVWYNGVRSVEKFKTGEQKTSGNVYLVLPWILLRRGELDGSLSSSSSIWSSSPLQSLSMLFLFGSTSVSCCWTKYATDFANPSLIPAVWEAGCHETLSNLKAICQVALGSDRLQVSDSLRPSVNWRCQGTFQWKRPDHHDPSFSCLWAVVSELTSSSCWH